jgi:hypothetical protein
MERKRKIINITLIVFIGVCIFFVIKFDVSEKIKDSINKSVEQNNAISDRDSQEELRYETFLDEEGNEIVIEMEKNIGEDKEGNKIEFWVDTAEHEIIYDYMYRGTIEKIEDNKIYFLVDKKSKNGSSFCEDVEDYQVIFDIDTYDLESDPYVGYNFCDFLSFDYENYHSSEDLNFLLSKYLRVCDYKFIDKNTGDSHKILEFFLK